MAGLIGGGAERLGKKMNNRLKQQEMEREREMIKTQLFLKECDKQLKIEMAAQRQQLEEFQKRMKAKKERGYINGKEGGGSTSIPSTSDTVRDFGNREEAFFISSVLQKLYSLSQHVELCERVVPVGDVKYIEGIINELSMILNFLRGKTSGEIKYLICKVMETALYLDNIMETDDEDMDLIELNSLRCRLRKIKMQMIKSGANGEEKEALILSVMQKLERHHVVVDDVKGVIDELRMILDFLREKKGEDLSRLDYLICEAIEMALYLDLNVGVFDLWKEITSVKSRLQGIKLRMLRSGFDGEDPEALVLLVIQKLDAQHGELAKFFGGAEDIKGVIHELRMILDFLRVEKTDLIILRRRHKYLICDLIEIALHLNEIEDTDNSDVSESVRSRLREIRLCILKSETETETETRSEDVEDMVGLDEQVQVVLQRAIFNEAEGFEISVITGMVGVGKTILARQVYNHATVVDRFERRAWVRVSSDLTHKEILIKLIQQVVLDSEQILQTDSSLILEEMDNQSLRHLLHQHLEGMAYLIVLNDLPKQMT